MFLYRINNGSAWKTTDYGRTLVPIFDDQPKGSIGAVIVAPSDHNVPYIGISESLTPSPILGIAKEYLYV